MRLLSKIQILLVPWALAPFPSGAGLRETLSARLAQYCIPKNAEDCSTPYALASYGAAGLCECPCEGMKYVAGDRKCVPCEFGSASLSATECNTPSCPAGMYLADLGSSPSCPGGMYLAGNAEEWQCNVASTHSCSAGYYRYDL